VRTVVVALLMTAALALAGCQDKPKTEAPTNAAMPEGHPPVGSAMPGAPGVDPHAGMQSTEIPDGVPTKKATVLQSIDADVYTYIEAKGEDGKNVWMALPTTKVENGATIEYPADVPAMADFSSKTLNRTFESILFVSGIKIVK